MINYYETPAEQRFIDTYVPVPTDQLMQMGQMYKQDYEDTQERLDKFATTYGDFVSPSERDMETWRKETYGRINPLLDQATKDPNFLKSAEGQAAVRQAIRSVDTATLGKLRQSAEALKTRQQVVAKLQAEGKYKGSWDKYGADVIRQWDTTKQGILTDLAPTEYQNLRELSNLYFKDLKPGFIESKRDPKSGVMMDYYGNTIKDIEAVADAQMNDILQTPQGQLHMRDLMMQAGIDPDKATDEQRQQGVSMLRQAIVDSNIDRTLRPNAKINEYYAQLSVQNAKNKPQYQPSTLHSLLATTAVQSAAGTTNYMNPVTSSVTIKDGKVNVNYDSPYLQYLKEVGQKYKGNKKISAAYSNAQKNIRDIYDLTSEAKQLQMQAIRTGDKGLANKAIEVAALAEGKLNQYNSRVAKWSAEQSFKKGAGFQFGVKSDKVFSHEGFMHGVKNVIDNMSFKASEAQTDILLSNIGGDKQDIVDDNGLKKQAYQFNTSGKFVLPETIVELSLGKRGRNTTRQGDDTNYFKLKELVESGKLYDVKAIPNNNELITYNDGGQITFGVKTKLRIPADQVRAALGTGIIQGTGQGTFWQNVGSVPINAIDFPEIAQESTTSAISRMFGGKLVKEAGDDGIEYFEIDAIKPVENNPALWQNINQDYWSTVKSQQKVNDPYTYNTIESSSR